MQLFTRNPNGVILNAYLRAYDLKPGTVLTHRSKHYQVVVGYNLDGKVWLVNRAGRLQRINVSDVLRNYCKRSSTCKQSHSDSERCLGKGSPFA